VCRESQQGKRHAQLIADRDKGGNVLGKTGATVTDPGVEKVPSYAAIHSDSVGNFFDISAAGLTNG
jgi:hypothetical protein